MSRTLVAPSAHWWLASVGLVMGWMLAALFAGASAAYAQSSEVTTGLYLMRIGDCMSCHTQAGGTPFAGGREMGTPYGTLSSTNITPDPDTGIGRWTDDDFYRAMHDGIGHHGEYPLSGHALYVLHEDDTRRPSGDQGLSVLTETGVRPAGTEWNGISVPCSVPLFVWRELFFRPGTFAANPAHSAEWNRGAYLVQGPAHCGECHSPRNVLGATEVRASLAGGAVGQWLAPNISSDPLDGDRPPVGERHRDCTCTAGRTGPWALHSGQWQRWFMTACAT